MTIDIIYYIERNYCLRGTPHITPCYYFCSQTCSNWLYNLRCDSTLIGRPQEDNGGYGGVTPT
jgi:hypothetical protein